MKKSFWFCMLLIIVLTVVLAACAEQSPLYISANPAQPPEYKEVANLQEEINAAAEGTTLYIADGNYDEELTVDKNIALIGKGKARIKSIKGAKGVEIKIKGLIFYSEEYPKDGEASLYIGEEGSLEAYACTFTVDVKNQAEDFPQQGGYGIFAEKFTKKISIEACMLTNYNYAVYITNTGARFNIYNNMLGYCKNSMGVDIRKPDAQSPQNLPASGRINGNHYIHNKFNSSFYYAGDKWPTALDVGVWSLSSGGKEVPMDKKA